MDTLTFDLLSNHKKKIKKKDYLVTKKDYPVKKVENTSTQILSNNINILNNNISKYNNNDLDTILNIMIETSKNIIQHKKNINNPINPNTINHLKKLINCVKSSPKNNNITKYKEIKIKSKIRKRNDK